MRTTDYTIGEHLSIARDTKAFSSEECSVLEEVLFEWQENPSKDYFLLEERRNGTLSGFIIYGPTPMTEFAWDLYWIIVNPRSQRQGIGLKLQKKMEEEMLQNNKQAVIRVETSGNCGYAGQRHFYEVAGYSENGRIQDFYGEGDDLVIYTKKIKAAR